MSIDSISRKCPGCGGNLVFSVKDQSLTCSFCGNAYSPEKLELLEQIRVFDEGSSDEREDDKNEIVCGSCGARVITEKNTSATFCAFCGSPSLVRERLTKQFRPDYLIPFKITKDEARKKIEEFGKQGRYVPKNFFSKRNSQKITGMYVPFWLMNSRCNIHTRGLGYKNHLSGRDRYQINSTMDIQFTNVPFDGALKIEDDLMESIEPFDCSEMVDFKSSYLQGFYAQRYDLSADKLSDRILARLERYGRETSQSAFSGYDKIDLGICDIKPHDLKQAYALYPVWILTYEYDGAIYKIAVNGQTGKVDGYLPVDKIKRGLRLGLYYAHNVAMTLPITGPLIFAVIFGILHPDIVYLIAFTLMIIGLFGLAPLVMMINEIKTDEEFGRYSVVNLPRKAWIKLISKRKDTLMKLKSETNNPLAKKPPVTEYYDTTAKISVEKDEQFEIREVYNDNVNL